MPDSLLRVPQFMTVGDEVVKYHQRHDGTAKRFLVWFEGALHWSPCHPQNLTAHALLSSKAHTHRHSAQLSEIQGVWNGKHAEQFLTSSGQAIDSSLCLTLVIYRQGRMQTVDVSLSSKEKRDQWIEGLESLKRRMNREIEKERRKLEGVGVVGKILVESEMQAVVEAKARLDRIKSHSNSLPPVNPALTSSLSSSVSQEPADDRERLDATTKLIAVQAESIERFTLELQSAYIKIAALERKLRLRDEKIRKLERTLKKKEETDKNGTLAVAVSSAHSGEPLESISGSDESGDDNSESLDEALVLNRTGVEYGFETECDDVPLSDRVKPPSDRGRVAAVPGASTGDAAVGVGASICVGLGVSDSEELANRAGRRENAAVLKKLQLLGTRSIRKTKSAEARLVFVDR